MRRYRRECRSASSLPPLLFALLLTAAPLAACARAMTDEAAGGNAAGATADAAEPADAAAHDAAGGTGDEGHVHPAGEDIPSRAEEEARDEYSKPLEVYTLAGVEAGDTVIDIGAGSGYNTYLVSDVVGDAGAVYAVRGNEGLQARLDHGDMAGRGNVILVGDTSEVADGAADVVLMIREYHLAEDHPAVLAEAMRMLKPGGRVAVVEVRLGADQREGYNHDAHRSGEDTIIAEFAEGGFELAEESDLLHLEGDDYTAYGGATGTRYITDRMLLIFGKPQ